MCLIVCLWFFIKLIFIRFTGRNFIRDPQTVVQYPTPSKGWFRPPFCPHLRGHGRLGLNPHGNDFWFALLVGSFDLGPVYKFVSAWWGHVFVCHLSRDLACWGRVSAYKAISRSCTSRLVCGSHISVEGLKITTLVEVNMWTQHVGDIGEVVDQSY
jgi:hypothetical protein